MKKKAFSTTESGNFLSFLNHIEPRTNSPVLPSTLATPVTEICRQVAYLGLHTHSPGAKGSIMEGRVHVYALCLHRPMYAGAFGGILASSKEHFE